jgi:hypothetical protein
LVFQNGFDVRALRQSEDPCGRGFDRDTSQRIRTTRETPPVKPAQNLFDFDNTCCEISSESLNGGGSFFPGLPPRGFRRRRTAFEQDNCPEFVIRGKFKESRPESGTDLLGVPPFRRLACPCSHDSTPKGGYGRALRASAGWTRP